MKTAIILSARKDRDSEIPFPLKEFTPGICLINRTLSILRENGYGKIIIVATTIASCSTGSRLTMYRLLSTRTMNLRPRWGPWPYARDWWMRISC